MAEWFGDMSGLERTFTLCAIVGAVLFVLRLVLQLIGGDTDGDIGDLGDAGDAGDLADSGGSDASFQFFSVQGMTAFLLIFGLTGRALLTESGVPPPWAIVGAVVAGLFTMWVVGMVFLLMRRMQSSGNLVMTNAVGQVGTVYLTIPAGGTGKIEVVIQKRLQVLDARSKGDVNIPTGSRVKVVDVFGPSTLVVEPMD